jgi:hypothetical protein
MKEAVKGLLMLFAALLTFGGPTYLLYIFDKLNIPHLLSILIGLASFTAGLVLFVYLLKGERKVGVSA